MNERIQQLADQAWEITAVSPDFGHPVTFADKLSELIVEDCISQIAMIGVSNVENNDVTWAVEKSIETIRSWFGV